MPAVMLSELRWVCDPGLDGRFEPADAERWMLFGGSAAGVCGRGTSMSVPPCGAFTNAMLTLSSGPSSPATDTGQYAGMSLLLTTERNGVPSERLPMCGMPVVEWERSDSRR